MGLAYERVDARCVRACIAWPMQWETDARPLAHSFAAEHRFDKAKAIRGHIVTMLRAKESFMDPKTKPEERKALRKQMRTNLTKCTAELGLHLTVTSADGVYADTLNTSTMELYRMYCAADAGYVGLRSALVGSASYSANDSSSPRPGANTLPSTSATALTADGATGGASGGKRSSHVQVFLKYNAFICKVDEENDSAVELLFSLYSIQKRRDISEPYVVHLTSRLMVQDLERIDLQKTIFANAELADTMLVCRVVRVGKISTRQKTASRYRIPFGVAMVPIAVVLKEKNSRFDNQLPIYRLESGSLSALMERIVQHSEPPPAPGSGVAVEIKVYNTPDLASLHDEVSDFDRLSVSNMLEMDPSNLRPGVVRNDLYLVIERGEMQQEGKKTAKNVELSISVRMADGTVSSARCSAHWR